MKKAGWILLAFGEISFLGAAFKGHSVSGPCFWIATGAAFLYFGKEREQARRKDMVIKNPGEQVLLQSTESTIRQEIHTMPTKQKKAIGECGGYSISAHHSATRGCHLLDFVFRWLYQ